MTVTTAQRGLALAILFGMIAVFPAAAFEIDTLLSTHVLDEGQNATYVFTVQGEGAGDVSVETYGPIARYLSIEEAESGPDLSIYDVTLLAPTVDEETSYAGGIAIQGENESQDHPVEMRVVDSDAVSFEFSVQFVSTTIRSAETPQVNTQIRNNQGRNVTLNVSYIFQRSSDAAELFNTTEAIEVGGSSASQTVEIDDLAEGLSAGSYYVRANFIYEDRVYSDIATLRVIEPFWTPFRIRLVSFLAIALLLLGGSWKGYQWYQEKRAEEARYVFPVDYNDLPDDEGGYWMGKVAETSKQSYIDPSDLTTHAIVAGSTGAGKSVTASVLIEEALEQDVPVVVFDPTAQWTGFVKECQDENVLEHYERFGLDPEEDTKPYKGLIKKFETEDVDDLDFTRLMEPGEVTVFTLNHLSTEEFDTVVRGIIDSLFEVEWEESADLELLVVFDEVHRLLEEYGGEGGYKALERGAREFRKWGIGLVMASQVTADFKQAVSGNILTEVQMQTKSMEDIKRAESKYGEQYAKRISSVEVGTGMIQNPEYNEGQPWFVDFRPPYHNPHKIPDEELEKYYEYTDWADELEDTIDQMEEDGEDVYDERLELKLARDKLKEGRFKMAEVYLNSLDEKLGS
ncbi:MAG: DUF853 family protein [Candidatus Nanohaloarchaeota archaeon QJJ-5]|nr:DUF853 family protein [Candidatus Nanohaloarchaeota archaeon QJJ-5]